MLEVATERHQEEGASDMPLVTLDALEFFVRKRCEISGTLFYSAGEARNITEALFGRKLSPGAWLNLKYLAAYILSTWPIPGREGSQLLGAWRPEVFATINNDSHPLEGKPPAPMIRRLAWADLRVMTLLCLYMRHSGKRIIPSRRWHSLATEVAAHSATIEAGGRCIPLDPDFRNQDRNCP